jgi:outer membrane protein TolC
VHKWHAVCLNPFQGQGRGSFMRTAYRAAITSREKSKKSQRAAKSRSSASIAQRYMELRRLRERVSEAESRLSAR